MSSSASASPISARLPGRRAPAGIRKCRSASAGRRGRRASTRPPPWAAYLGSQRVGELERAHQPVLIALERPAVAAREIVHTRLDLDEREGAGLELGGGRMVRRSVARTMRPVGHEIDPAGVIDPDLARDQGVLAAQPRPYLLGKLGGHLAAVSFPLHGAHSPSM